MAGNDQPKTRTGPVFYRTRFFLIILLFPFAQQGHADLVKTIKAIKPSVVGVGTLLRTRTPPAILQGTGFVVSDGHHAITNYHVVARELNTQRNERYAIFIGKGQDAEIRVVKVLAVDKDHDLALLRFIGSRLPTVKLGPDAFANEGQLCAFTGFPIGTALGLYPVTHRGIISSLTPIASRVGNSRQLTAALISRLRDTFNIYQLDATAYPGNSGSPLYNMDSGEVIGVLNMVFVKESKEAVLAKPSGISYAIPVKYVRQLLAEKNMQP